MEIEKTRGYGLAASDVEGSWDPDLKTKMKNTTICSKLMFAEILYINKN